MRKPSEQFALKKKEEAILSAQRGTPASRASEAELLEDGAVEAFYPVVFNTLLPELIVNLPAALAAVQSGQQGGQRAAGVPTAQPAAMDTAIDNRSFANLVAALVPAITTLAPDLILAVQSEGAQEDGSAETDDAAPEVSSDFLSSLFGIVSPVIMDHLPMVIQALQGGQSTVRSDLIVSDTEVQQRVFGPILSAAMSALLSATPKLIEAIHGVQGRVVKTEEVRTSRGLFDLNPVSWQEIEQTNRLRDGDILQVQVSDTEPGWTGFVLSLAPWKDWWKGLEVLDGTGARIGFAEVEGNTKESTTVWVESRYLDPGGRIVLWKAKLFGVHTGMYVCADIQHLKGKVARFEWIAD